MSSPPRQASPSDARRTAVQHGDDQATRGYLRFGAMILVSTTVMFGVMYLNTYELSHVEFSETRLYMSLLMGATMTAIMLAFMLGMHRNRKVNAAIFGLAALVFVGALWLVRSQSAVEDRTYMRGMTPHHSIAVLTSANAEIRDARVRKLADGIIASQCREISEMQWLIDDIDANGRATTPADAAARPVPEFDDRC
ncbi:MAG: DUF305 domain-containing protein [Acidimicrobiales bacterium]